MKKYLLSFMLLFSAGAVALPAAAVPFVQENSSYTFYLQGSTSTDALLGEAIFDNVAEDVFFRNRTITVTESETALGNGQSRINFDLVFSSAGFFVTPGEEIIFGIGTNGNGFDLLGNVPLTNATITLFGGNQVLASFDDVQDVIDQIDPWDGLVPALDSTLVLSGDGLDATQITRISFDFLVGTASTEVPEPGSILLCAIGLLATMTVMRRRRS